MTDSAGEDRCSGSDGTGRVDGDGTRGGESPTAADQRGGRSGESASERASGSGSGRPVVAVEDVHKRYRLGDGDEGTTVEALAGVSLTLSPGSYTAVMGPSGSGKSTLLNLVGALDTPTEGRVWVDGRRIDDADESDLAALRGTEVGFVFQTFNLVPRMTAVENVALPLVFDGVDREPRRERARGLLDRVGLGDRLDHQPTQLSGGQRQRVAIARALAPDPAVVLADEPTGNVDTDTGAGILALLREVNDQGNAVLLVTHDRRVAERADRIVHVRDGVVEGVESVADVDPAARAGSGADDSRDAVGTDGTGGTGDPGDDGAGAGDDDGANGQRDR